MEVNLGKADSNKTTMTLTKLSTYSQKLPLTDLSQEIGSEHTVIFQKLSFERCFLPSPSIQFLRSKRPWAINFSIFFRV